MFEKSERAKLDALNLNFADYSTLIQQAIQVVINGDPEGENQTPDMT
jgi:hypothetical protein